jgi:dynein heavy chain
MKQTNLNNSVSRSLGKYTKTDQTYLEIFKQNNKILDEIQKSLELYLEKKR